MVKNVIIIHGYGADPYSNWFNWLKVELEEAGLNAIVPDFGQALRPNFSHWRSVLDSVVENLDPSETVLVGHSLGGALIPRYLSTYEGEAFAASFLVAAPFDHLNWKNLKGFFEDAVFEASAGEKMGELTILASDDDPHVPLDHSDKYKEMFGGEVVVEKNKEHLWQPEYERLRDLVLELS